MPWGHLVRRGHGGLLGRRPMGAADGSVCPGNVRECHGTLGESSSLHQKLKAHRGLHHRHAGKGDESRPWEGRSETSSPTRETAGTEGMPPLARNLLDLEPPKTPVSCILN